MRERQEPPQTVIRTYEDGPLLIRGDFQLLDERGEVIDPRRGTIALCRCGRSSLKPFCDGSHALARRGRGARSPAEEGTGSAARACAGDAARDDAGPSTQ